MISAASAHVVSSCRIFRRSDDDEYRARNGVGWGRNVDSLFLFFFCVTERVCVRVCGGCTFFSLLLLGVGETHRLGKREGDDLDMLVVSHRPSCAFVLWARTNLSRACAWVGAVRASGDEMKVRNGDLFSSFFSSIIHSCFTNILPT